jgi:uncharacterized membrane protein YeaQ/YmgE (transglycosylase-associated protein family)
MTLEWLLFIIAIWLGIGAVIAAWIYKDTKVRKNAAEWNWVGIGFLLSIIGAIIYIVAANAEKKRGYQYPPATKYENPDYIMEGGKKETEPQATPSAPGQSGTASDDKKEIKQIDGLPRCRHCGAAISEHDWQCPKCGTKLKY